MLPFVVQASSGCSTPCHLALALAAEFARVRAARAEHAIDELAAWLVGARDDEPIDQLHALADLTGAAPRPRAAELARRGPRKDRPGRRVVGPD
jgi:hypothetical protein